MLADCIPKTNIDILEMNIDIRQGGG